MQNLIDSYFNSFFKFGLVAVILATYFLFTNLTTEPFDMTKFLVLLVFTAIMFILTTVRYAVENRVRFIKTPFDLPFLLLLVVGIASTIASKAPFVSVFGNQMRIHGSFTSLVVYILFYFVLTQNLRTKRLVKYILSVSVGLGAVLAILTLASYFGIRQLPLTLSGSSFSTAAILAVLIPIIAYQILNYKNFTFMIINSALLTLFAITIALTGGLATWIGATLGLVMTFLALNPPREIKLSTFFYRHEVIAILVSLVITALVVALSFIPPVGSTQNPFYNAAKSFPREIQLDFNTSWKVSVSAFRDSPFWGTGPASYLFNFTTYKPVDFNSSPYWNIRFDSAFNDYLQTLASLGGVGMLAYLSLAALFLTQIFRVLKYKEPLNVGLAASGVSIFAILAFHVSTLPFFIIALMIFACFWVANEDQTIPFPFNFTNLASESLLKVEALPSILLTLSIALVLFGGFFAGKFYLADLHHKNALRAVSQNNGVTAYNELITSEKLNPWSDLYRTDLAQVNFALANAIALSKAPTESSPAGSLTDQDKQNIQVLLQQSINEGKTATTLSPRSTINWEILAVLYRQIAGVAQNALLFSLDSYGHAIFNDPLNPALRLNVGGVYYAVKSYDLAIRFFTDAINLKPDFANGYYNLSVALRDKGDLNGALQAGQKVIDLIDKNSPDYKTASDYLNDLKVKAGVPSQPPAATASGQLQNENLPKVINLPKPEKIATPEAIKKPSPSPSAQP